MVYRLIIYFQVFLTVVYGLGTNVTNSSIPSLQPTSGGPSNANWTDGHPNPFSMDYSSLQQLHRSFSMPFSILVAPGGGPQHPSTAPTGGFYSGYHSMFRSHSSSIEFSTERSLPYEQRPKLIVEAKCGLPVEGHFEAMLLPQEPICDVFFASGDASKFLFGYSSDASATSGQLQVTVRGPNGAFIRYADSWYPVVDGFNTSTYVHWSNTDGLHYNDTFYHHRNVVPNASIPYASGIGAYQICVMNAGSSAFNSIGRLYLYSLSGCAQVQTSPPSVLPTVSPSGQPSLAPTARPSVVPTSKPTTKPTAAPSPQPGQPTLSPTRVPTAIPTAKPSLVPTAAPTAGPTTFKPTANPTFSPTAKPTLTPTSGPTVVPTAAPSFKPTVSPTLVPTAKPTTSPTLAPTLIPTANPTIKPTTGPSESPTLRPSASPTEVPTPGPTQNPTIKPTTGPSQAPTPFPSATPTDSPTPSPTQSPTDRPSAEPTFAPSAKPSFAPTQKPTATPSASPTARPSTARPTTARPTSQPTVAPETFWLDKYNTLLASATSSSAYQVTYGYARYEDENLVGACNDWNVFLSSSLAVYAAKYRVQSVVLKSLRSNSTVGLASASVTTSTCGSDDTSATAIVQNLIQGSPTGSVNVYNSDVTCGGSWSTASCLNNGKFYASGCVGCSADDFCTDYNCGDNVFSPCGSYCSSSDAGSMFVLVVSFYSPEPAPTATSIAISQITNSSATGTVTLSADGRAYCGVFGGGTSPTSIGSIEIQNYNLATSNKVAVFKFTGLTPVLSYTVFCSTLSIDNVKSTLDVVKGSTFAHPTFTTSCCKTAAVNVFFQSAVEDASVSGAVKVTLDSLPAVALTVTFQLKDSNGALSNVAFFPATLSFTSQSVLSQTVNFAGVHLAGSYTIVPTLSGSSQSNFALAYTKGVSSLDISIISSTSEPPTPTFLSAQFADTGSYLTLSFSAATDMGGQGTSGFDCALLLTFPGSSSANLCQFSADGSQMNVYLRDAVIVIGDSVSLIANKVKAKCTANSAATCLSWAYIAAKTVTLQGASNPITPLVLLTSPGTIGSCDSYLIDASSSTGNGGRAWSSITFVVSGAAAIQSSINEIQAFLNANYTVSNMAPPPAVPRYLLPAGNTISVSVTLCNFLNGCGEVSTSLVILNNILPTVTIVGASSQSVYRSDVTTLKASGYTLQCDGTSSVKNLVFTWAVYLNDVLTTISSSTSNDPKTFTLAPYVLTVGNTYVVQVTVYNSVTSTSSTSSVSVYVKSNLIVAAIAGGQSQSIRQGDGSSTLDASSTEDLDCDPSATSGCATLTYAWSCIQVSPSFSATCPVTITGAKTGKTLVISVTGTATLNSVAEITVKVSDGTRTSTAVVDVTSLPAAAPVVTTSSTLSGKLNVDDKLKLQGSVTAAASGSYVWSVSDSSINIKDNALSVIDSTFTASSSTTFPVNFILSGGVLPARAVLTFTLTCTLDGGASSYGSVVVTTNGPPLPGLFTVSPSSGIELSDTFTFAASLWTDDDLPLGYSFGFYPSSTSTSILTLRTTSASPYMSANLPSGKSEDGNFLACVVTVVDSLNSPSYLTYSVKVNPLAHNDTLLASIIDDLLDASAGDADSTQKAASASANVLNNVNCTLAPTCSALNRNNCSAVQNTCGSCLSALYVGVIGDSNDMCVLYTDIGARRLAGSSCTTDDDCSGLFAVCDSNECVVPSKSCPRDCNGKGTCVFVDHYWQTVDSCVLSDVDCMAVCDCNDGYGGDQCQFTSDELDAKMAMRTSLVNSLLSLTEMQEATSNSVTSLLNSLLSVVQNPDQLDPTSLTDLFEVINVVIENARTADVSPSVIEDILHVIELVNRAGKSSARRRRLAENVDSNTLQAVENYVASVQDDIVFGEPDNTYIENSFRVVTTMVQINTDSDLSLPRTELEVNDGLVTSSSSTQVTKNSLKNPYFTYSLVSVLSSDTSLDNGDMIEIISNSNRPCTPTANSPCKSTITLQNREAVTDAVDFGTDAPVPVRCSLTCEAGDTTSTSTCSCPVGDDVVLTCGGDAVILKAYCGTTQTVQRCASYVNDELTTDLCVVQDYDENSIECLCTVASTASSTTNANFVPISYDVITDSVIASEVVAKFSLSGVSLSDFDDTNGPYYLGMQATLTTVMSPAIITDITLTDESARRLIDSSEEENQDVHNLRNLAASKVGVLTSVDLPKTSTLTSFTSKLNTALSGGSSSTFVSSFKSNIAKNGGDASSVKITSTSASTSAGGVPTQSPTLAPSGSGSSSSPMMYIIIGVVVGGVVLASGALYFIHSRKQTNKIFASAT